MHEGRHVQSHYHSPLLVRRQHYAQNTTQQKGNPHSLRDPAQGMWRLQRQHHLPNDFKEEQQKRTQGQNSSFAERN